MKKYCVISHTHWDREWYMPFEQFRLRLVDLVDNLLDIIKEYPDFIFHLDAQTIVLEDYLAIRPENKDILSEYIKSGNIIVGPWYMQNDFYLTSGESTIRNLITGSKIAEEFGSCGKVGYAPDQFGNISQLPQILHNFGIDNFVFGRGYHEYSREIEGKKRSFSGDLPPFICGDLAGDGIDGAKRVFKPAEFIWKGADGSELLAVCMLYWYNNAQRFSPNIDNAKLVLDVNSYLFDEYATTPYLLMMNGVDHLEAQEDLLPILEKLNKILPVGESVKQMKLEDYINDVKKYIKENKLDMFVQEGELRLGSDNEILNGTLSSRHYIKVDNILAQNMLENRIEPIYSMLDYNGSEMYSLDHMNFLWKSLLKNHPHDSICGCSRDEVHKHMEDNYERLEEAAGMWLNKGIKEIATHCAAADGNIDEYILTAINTTEKPVSGVIQTELNFPINEEVNNFTVTDCAGNEAKFVILSKTKKTLSIFSPINLPGEKEVDSYKIQLYADNVNGYAVKSYKIKKTEGYASVNSAVYSTKMTNEFISVSVESDGKVNLTDLASGQVYKDIIDFEDVGDRGNSYIFEQAEGAVYSKKDMCIKVTPLDSSLFSQAVKIDYEMNIPAYFDYNLNKRCDTYKAKCMVSLELKLQKGSRYLQAAYSVNNEAKDHRLRILICPDIMSKITSADIPFDIIQSEYGKECCVTKSRVHPNTSFVTIEDENKSIAVFTEGAIEYEHLYEQNKLAFTLLRANGKISGDVVSGLSEQWLVPDNQCIRTINGRIAVMPYTGNYIDREVVRYAKEFRNPLVPGFVSNDPKKYMGGKAAVQDSGVKEVFIRPDKNKNLKFKDNEPAVLIDADKGVTVTAFKKAEDGKGFILRFVNMSNETKNFKLKAEGKQIFLTSMSEKNNELLGKNEITGSLNKKEIRTIRII